jgi:hypothetical protein
MVDKLILKKKETRLTSCVSMHRQVHEKVHRLAEDENRSVSRMIAILVKEALILRGVIPSKELEGAPDRSKS